MLNGWVKLNKVAFIGYMNLCGKVMIKKILKYIQKDIEIYLIDIDQDIKEKELFASNNFFSQVKERFVKLIKFINMKQIKQIGQIDVLFNTFEAFDWTNLDKSLKSHVLKSYILCEHLAKSNIRKCVMHSPIYGCFPGLISQNNEYQTYMNYIPKQQNFKQSITGFLQQNFENDFEKWQWSIKFMEESYKKVIKNITIVRIGMIGPTIEQDQGYVDHFNLFTLLLYQMGNGFISNLKGKKGNFIDIIPADFISNYMLAISVLYDQSNQNQSFSIHNLSTSTRNPLNLNNFVMFVCQGWKQYQQICSVKVQKNQLLQKVSLLKQKLPILAQNRLGTLLDIKSWKIQSQKKNIQLQKKKQFIKKYSQILQHQWICQSNKSIDLFAKLLQSEQKCFNFNVSTLQWNRYIKICIYGIKKYLLGEHVEGFSPNNLDLLTMCDSFYFSDIMWAITSGKQILAYSTNEIKNFILSSKGVRQQIDRLVEHQMARLKKNPTSYQKVRQMCEKSAEQICDEMFSQYSMKWIRMFAWFLHKTIKSMYQKVVIDKKQLSIIRSHDEKFNGPLIIIPTHRSYMDFLLISYIFFRNTIKCPHIVAAQDFLNMALIHILLRRSGAFFIKRNNIKNKNLYKAIMNEYISKLIQDNHYLQFFIEGSRSRVGKMLPPKFGILSIVCKNVMEGKIKDARILPVTLNYERVLEGSSFTYQLMGQPKVKESLTRVIRSVDVLSKQYGRIYIQFGQMISLKDYFQKESGVYQQKLMKFGYKIVHELSNHLVVTPPAILSTAMLMFRKGISDDSLNQWINWIAKEIASRHIKIARSQSDFSISLNNSLSVLSDVFNRSKSNIFQVQLSFDQNSFVKLFTLTYYRNTITHIFFQQAIIITALRKNGYQNIISQFVTVDKLFTDSCFLYSILSNEYVLEHRLSNQDRFMDLINLLEKKDAFRVRDEKVNVTDPNGNYFIFYSSLIWPIVECYWATLLYFFKMANSSHSIPINKLLSQLQWFIQSLITEKVLQYMEAVSLDTIKNAVNKFLELKVIGKIGENGEIKVLLEENKLKEFHNRLKRFLKSSYAYTLSGVLETGSSVANLDFPFLSKL